MKKWFLWCLVLALLMPAAASAEDEVFSFDPETGAILDYLGTETDVVVPAEIDGAAVVRIGDGAFRDDNLSLTSIVLPEGLEVIGGDAFRYQELLGAVDCPDSVRVIAADAFHYGFSGEQFDWPEALEEIGPRAFYGTALTGTVALPPNVAAIGEKAFASTDIEAVVLPGAALRIAGDAFEDCDYLRQIILPWDTDEEARAALAALFAEANPDAMVVLAEPPVFPSEEEFARYGGVWYLNTVEQGGTSVSAADVGMAITLQLGEDGTALMLDDGGEGTWAVEGESMVLSLEDSDDVIFTEADGLMTAAQDGLALVFGREPAEAGFTPGEPVAAATAEEFDGTWECAWAGVYDMMIPAEMYGDSLAEMVGFASLTMEIRASSVRMVGEQSAESFRFEDGALRSLSGLTRTLTLLDDGMLACDLGEGTLYFIRAEGEAAPSAPEPEAEPTEEPTPEPTEEPTPEPTEEPTPEPTEEPTPEPTEEPTLEPTEEPTLEPTEEPTPEPTEEPARVDPEIEARYACTRALVSGVQIDPTALGGAFAVTFHADGAATLVLAGVELTDLHWRVEEGAVVLEYIAGAPLRLVPDGDGYTLDYTYATRLCFAAD